MVMDDQFKAESMSQAEKCFVATLKTLWKSFGDITIHAIGHNMDTICTYVFKLCLHDKFVFYVDVTLEKNMFMSHGYFCEINFQDTDTW